MPNRLPPRTGGGVADANVGRALRNTGNREMKIVTYNSQFGSGDDGRIDLGRIARLTRRDTL